MFARGFVTRCSELNIVVMCAGTMLAAPEIKFQWTELTERLSRVLFTSVVEK
ncbi:hypothetical protein KIN20_032156 [Parelaphostrongylus tenuis]|uniref:Uncharacterized protein n=1 Tax=Parelaphostrongylus tenuis TaxID=148309 RepID=A0AAD5R6K2_PARTN|nr:hypothetical protein KIN20_032156 [Parelaphostrongylus tenuis]